MSIKVSDIKPFKADINKQSPNYNTRKRSNIANIVLHATAGSDAGAESWMMNPAAKVSAHFHVRRDGTVVRLVNDINRAWHAGVATWKGDNDINSNSIGIEIGNRNDGIEPYTDAQYKAVARIIKHYTAQGTIDIVSHAQIAPGRKNDPYGWDWEKMWEMV